MRRVVSNGLASSLSETVHVPRLVWPPLSSPLSESVYVPQLSGHTFVATFVEETSMSPGPLPTPLSPPLSGQHVTFP